ncbi:bifunctional glutamate N-acetyltransferase/amino-acid acetyltransferase ArgJ [bacterium]|nr:MAG: bifunctional glutamate N-acetyltransferase/amino-acid acetyltransferase ArgJ [bacterium]
MIYKKAILPKGFKASALACGLKKSGKLDLALFYSAASAKAACLFTANIIQAAPLKVTKKYLKNNKAFRAVIANSGNANCFTGKAGLKDAQGMSALTAKELGIKKEAVLVASTGIIGRRLKLDKIKKAMPALVKSLSPNGIAKAKRAIMTTDTFAKEITVKFNSAGKTITICGIAKGAGMIAPNLATLLCFIFTDADITQGALKQALKIAADDSFNCITVDGCMSTNDMAMLLANGAAGNSLIDTDRNFGAFSKALNTVCLELAKMVVKDAEGATKFIQIRVENAKTGKEAKQVALSIANSSLFKTAMFASSKNILGRTVAAAGASGVDIKEEDLKISSSPLKKKEVNINVSLKRGKSSATVYTSDLSYEYVKINAEYN